MVDTRLAQKQHWKLGDRIVIKGAGFPVDLNLTLRAIYTSPGPTDTLFFDDRSISFATLEM